MKKKKGFYVTEAGVSKRRDPPPWRKRIAKTISGLALEVDYLQRQIELSIRWQRQYSKYFAIEVSMPDEEIQIKTALIKYAFPDLKKVEVTNNPYQYGFSKIIRGFISGERPELRRPKLTYQEKGEGGNKK